MKRVFTIVCLFVVICVCLTACKSGDYEKAVELQEAGDYAAALEIYTTLDGYKDSTERINYCNSMIAAIEAHNDAAKLFGTAQTTLSQKNEKLDNAVSSAEALIAEGTPALDPDVYPTLETTIATAKAARMEIPAMPDETDAILALIPELDSVDYSDVLADILEAQEAVKYSVAQYALVDAPTEAYIIDCLGKVAGITGISAATEDNDPNGNLNKAGGYTAQVYFSYELVDQSTVTGNTIIEKGTKCGGSIEVYTSVADAEKRNSYLATFDGTPFATGSHVVIGTVVVRTSHKLTATQQKDLEARIIEALITIEE